MYLPRYLTRSIRSGAATDDEIRGRSCAGSGGCIPSSGRRTSVPFRSAGSGEMLAITTLDYSDEALPPVRTSLTRTCSS